MQALLTQCCEHLVAAEADLSARDAKSADGAAGSALAPAARAAIDARDRLPPADLTQLCRVMGLELGRTMGISSGV